MSDKIESLADRYTARITRTMAREPNVYGAFDWAMIASLLVTLFQSCIAQNIEEEADQARGWWGWITGRRARLVNALAARDGWTRGQAKAAVKELLAADRADFDELAKAQKAARQAAREVRRYA